MAESNVPRGVEEAADLAEKLHAQMFNTDAPEPEQAEGSEEDISDVSDVNETGDIEEDEEEDIPNDADMVELKKFKNRYLSLKGKYDAEVPRLAAELRELKAQFNAPQQKEAPKQEEEENPLKTLSEAYGEDFVSDLRKLIGLETKQHLAPVQQQAQSVEDTQIKAAQENFKGYLDSKVENGNWRDLWEGKDPKFAEFLQKPDPSGLYTYGDLVQMYNDNWDADKLAKVFNAYNNENKPVAKQKRSEPHPQQDAMIAPNRSNSQPSPKTDQGKIWTQDDITSFQRKDAQGKFSVDESKALWDDLLAALAENRIR